MIVISDLNRFPSRPSCKYSTHAQLSCRKQKFDHLMSTLYRYVKKIKSQFISASHFISFLFFPIAVFLTPSHPTAASIIRHYVPAIRNENPRDRYYNPGCDCGFVTFATSLGSHVSDALPLHFLHPFAYTIIRLAIRNHARRCCTGVGGGHQCKTL